MYETDISVKKEILTINRIGSGRAAITVYYEFFNPKSYKELEVGFEAVSPYGDVTMLHSTFLPPSEGWAVLFIFAPNYV